MNGRKTLSRVGRRKTRMEAAGKRTKKICVGWKRENMTTGGRRILAKKFYQGEGVGGKFCLPKIIREGKGQRSNRSNMASKNSIGKLKEEKEKDLRS